MSWLKKDCPKKIVTTKKKGVPDGLWIKCEHCENFLYQVDLKKNLNVCLHCGHHHYISAQDRLLSFFDENCVLESIAQNVTAQDPLHFKDTQSYQERLKTAEKQTGETEALVVKKGMLYNNLVVAACFEFKFIGGSMSSGVGERFAQGVEAAIQARCPFVCFCASGGARMQEGMFSLLQMAKTAAVIGQLHQAKLPYISVLCDPTMGGVSASLAMLGDIIIAEPHALIGFSGPRVIEQTIRQVLPEGFQSSEFLFKHGAIDKIVERQSLRNVIGSLIAKLMNYPPVQAKRME
jgi:acetyl-CoA carboxylase carboxyl transferase subunit beta